MISKVLMDSDISHDEFMLGINEEKAVLEWKKSIKTRDIQLHDIDRDR